MNPVAEVHRLIDGDAQYPAIVLWCPGCEITDPDGHKHGGLHMLPVVTDGTSAQQPRTTWDWNGDLVNVTLNPSILTHMNRGEQEFRCHSFLRDGQWQFLGDCTHALANQTVAMVPLPDWVVGDVRE